MSALLLNNGNNSGFFVITPPSSLLHPAHIITRLTNALENDAARTPNLPMELATFNAYQIASGPKRTQWSRAVTAPIQILEIKELVPL